jgi:cytochrome b involved in lipid metabolism
MSKELKIGIIGIVIILAFTFILTIQYRNSNPPSGVKTQTNTIPSSVTTKQSITLTAENIKIHNTEKDCWLIISNKVYDVTSYLPVHPGGKRQIISLCGQDATVTFDTKGGKGEHSPSAYTNLDKLYLGDLENSK